MTAPTPEQPVTPELARRAAEHFLRYSESGDAFREKIADAARDDFRTLLARRVAAIAQVSPQTVLRWFSGENEPHPAMQETVLAALARHQSKGAKS